MLLLGLSRPDVLEFLGPDGRSADPNSAEIVRVIDERPTEELGVEYVDPSELALVYAAARALLEHRAGQRGLAGAIEVLTETMFGESQPVAAPRSWNEPLPPFRRAVARAPQGRHRLLARLAAGRHRADHRALPPVQTRRGWEVDAGPPDDRGRLRTYLLPNVREYDVLDDTFDPPEDLEPLLDAQRATETVRVQIPHDALWAADFFAEEVTPRRRRRPTATLDLDLLPPVPAGGPSAAGCW